jgi:hypothetical protein
VNLHTANPRQLAQAISLNRRNFLRSVTGAGAAAALFGSAAPLRGMVAPRRKKAVVVTFGGGARDDETFMPDGQENIPHLLNELIPQATFFTQVVNKGILGHYVATASIVTGVYETFNNFAAVPPDRLRILPQRSEAPRHRRMGGRAQQRFRAHWREWTQSLRPWPGCGRDPA